MDQTVRFAADKSMKHLMCTASVFKERMKWLNDTIVLESFELES